MKKRFNEFFQDQDGDLSMTRLLCFFLALTWCAIALKTWAIPPHTTELSGMLLALYGANSLRNAVQSFAGPKAPPNQ